MSRIGKNPITIPEGVTVEVKDNEVTAKGKLGELSQEIKEIDVKIEDGVITLERPSELNTHKSKHGLYRASNQGQKLDLALGFSHNIVLDIAPEVKVETVSEKGKNPIVKLTSHDKQLVGQVAAKIRSFRKPEPYKGKGVKYVGEQLRRKAGKTA
jgi:large subunit ribosomal protein L6